MAKKKAEDIDIRVEKPDIKKEEPGEEHAVQLPMNYILLGEVEHDDLKVYIKQDVYIAIEKLAESDTSKELGGILVGNYQEDLGKTHVVISGCIEAKYTDASASTLTFTHETWDYVHQEQERLYPDMRIVGWQHTHPGYGIFLSNYDMFIQQNFFNLPVQVAYVVDPVQDTRGFFQWKGGKVEKLKGYHVFDDIGKPIKLDVEKKSGGAPAPETKRFRKRLRVALVCGAALFAILGGCIVYLLLGNGQLVSALEIARTQQAALESKQAEIDQIITYYETLPDGETISELQEQIDEQQIVILEQAGTIEELQTSLKDLEPEPGEYVYFMSYTVEKGDSLSEICGKYGIDYAANRRILLGVNGIRDANLIHVGQTILIPTSLISSGN